MNIRSLLAVILVFSTGLEVRAAPASCLSETDEATIQKKSPNAAAAARQIAQLCRQVGLEPTSNGATSLVEVIKLALAEKRARGDRLKPAAPAGFPTGPVLPRNGLIVLELGDVEAESIKSLDVTGLNVQIHLRAPVTGPVRIASSELHFDAEYGWTVVTGRQTYTGSFRLPDREIAKRASARVEALKALSDNTITLLALEAAIYDDEEIYASRDQVAALLRRELDKP